MKVGLIGLEDEFDNLYTQAGICKYMHNLFIEGNRLEDLEIQPIKYKRLSHKLPWLNHMAIYLQQGFSKGMKEFNLIHNPNGLRWFKLKGKPLVTTVHDIMPLTNSKRSLNGIKGKLIALNSEFSDYIAVKGIKMAMQSDAIIVDAPQDKDDINKYFDYPKENIYPIRLAIDEQFIYIPIPKKKSKKFTIGWYGSFNQTKNPEMALNAFSLIGSKDMEFVLWGNGSEEWSLLKNEYSKDKRIKFMGNCKEDEKVGVFDSFDLFLHPSEYESIIHYEALSRGIPTIIKKDSKMHADLWHHCIPVENEVQVADMIKDIKENGYDEKKLEYSIEWARQFTWRRNAEEVAEVYKRVLE